MDKFETSIEGTKVFPSFYLKLRKIGIKFIKKTFPNLKFNYLYCNHSNKMNVVNLLINVR